MQRPALLRIDDDRSVSARRTLCRDALSAGFDGLEIVLNQGAEPPVIPDGAKPVIAVAARCASTDTEAGLAEISSLLERCTSLHATCLNLELAPVRGPGDETGFARYQDALNFAYGLLKGARHEAEAAGVGIALEAATNGCLMSPVECKELVNQANSWAVGICLDVDRIAQIGKPADWILTLSHRIHAVRVRVEDSTYGLSSSPRPSPVDWRAISEALASVHYERPVIASAVGPLKIARTRLLDLGCSTVTA